MSSKLSGILDKMMTTETLLVDSVEALSKMSFQNFSIVDATNPESSGVGSVASDTMASDGMSYQFTSTSTAQTIFLCNFSDVKFGNYSLCVRIKSSNNTSTSDILTLKITRGSSELLSKGIKGTNFNKTDNYCYFCVSFTYDGTNSAKEPLTFKLDSTAVSGVNFCFDYAYITLITPAVYI